jgi:hypothetical protein
VREVALVEREVRLSEGGECWWAGRDVDAEDVGAGCEEGGCCGEADAGGGAGYYYGLLLRSSMPVSAGVVWDWRDVEPTKVVMYWCR